MVSLWETKSLRDRVIQIHLNHAPCVALRVSAALFPALVLGIFWARATRAGAIASMLVGLGLTLYYIARMEFGGHAWLGLGEEMLGPWFDLHSTSAGVFGIVAGFVTHVVVSLLTPPPGREIRDFIESVRYPYAN